MTDQINPPEEAPKTRTPRAKADALPQDINAIIPLIRKELGAVAKDQESAVGTKYKYRGHDQIVNAIVPLFDKYGVYTTVEDTSLYYEGRNAGNKYATASLIRKAVTFWAPDGSSRTSTIVAESVDYGNKATGQAGTYGYRIALEQTFTIPTGLPDPDADASELEPTSAAPVAPPPPVQPQAAANPEIAALKKQIGDSYAAIGITKEQIAEHGNRFFNNREGWDGNVGALGKLLAAIQAGDPKAIGA